MKSWIAPLVPLLALLLSPAGAGSPPSAPDQLLVDTDRGSVVGIRSESMQEFLGLPYAAPPVGHLRWRPPTVHARWSVPRDASRFGHHCPQYDSIFGTESLTEDCLYLNVFAPDRPRHASKSRLLPVMVWIHGGALFLGESDDYLPRRLVELGRVVVVTINYRLGALGYLAHPALSAESMGRISGNYGFMDQQFALRWVQRNIEAFGGDARNVTIFGESAGGLSVLAHLVAPGSSGLFHRAIVQSGAYAVRLPNLAEKEAEGETFAADIGCQGQGTRCLRSISLRKILAAWYEPMFNVDRDVIPESLDAAFADGQFQHVPVIQGTTHDEGRFLTALAWDLGTGPLTRKEYPAAVASQVGADAAAPVLSRYRLGSYASPDLALAAVVTDAEFACPAHAVDQLLASRVPVFAFQFDDANAPEVYLPPVSFSYGATHATELAYLFTLSRGGNLDRQQTALSDRMIGYWARFAASGDPNSSDAPYWPRFDSATDAVQALRPPEPVTSSGFMAAHKCRLWASLSGI